MRACGVNNVDRIEKSRRYQFTTLSQLSDTQTEAIQSVLYDRMTECVYHSLLASFTSSNTIKPVVQIPVLTEGSTALTLVNKQMGMGLDNTDIQYYTHLFTEILRRDPTDMELFDIGKRL